MSAMSSPETRSIPLLSLALRGAVSVRWGEQCLSSAAALACRRVIDWIVPPRCLGCAATVADPASLCAACWLKLNFIEEPRCGRLGIPFAYDQGDGVVSAAALADPPAWDEARAAVGYDEAARGLVQELKYRDRHEAAVLMTRLMRRAGDDVLGQADAVVPVPLHRWRLWRRRYNQSALLAQRIARASGCAFRPDLLERIRPTRPQVGLDIAARHSNVRRAFAVPSRSASHVYGKNIVLVDDVLTTGATAAACTGALRAAGAKRVAVLTFALVLEPRRLHI